MLDRETTPRSSESDASLRETTRLLSNAWSSDIQGFIILDKGPAELMGAVDVYNKYKHCSNNPTDIQFNNQLERAIIQIATHQEL